MSPGTKTAYRHAIGETKLVCRDVSMRAVQSLGTRLVEGYVLYGVHIAVQLERRAREAEKIKAEPMTIITPPVVPSSPGDRWSSRSCGSARSVTVSGSCSPLTDWSHWLHWSRLTLLGPRRGSVAPSGNQATRGPLRQV
jgi:hypothetical protein